MEVNLNIAKDLEGLTTLLSELIKLTQEYQVEENIEVKLQLERLSKDIYQKCINYIDTTIRNLLVYKIHRREVIPKHSLELLKEHYSGKRHVNMTEIKVQPDNCMIIYNLLEKLNYIDKDYVKIILSIL